MVAAEAQHQEAKQAYERQIEHLRSQLSGKIKRIEQLDLETSEHVAEKSKLQTEALKDKQLVMESQNELGSLKLKIKEMELENKGRSIEQSEAGADPQKQELYQALLKSNMELQTEKMTKAFEEKERELKMELAKLQE